MSMPSIRRPVLALALLLSACSDAPRSPIQGEARPPVPAAAESATPVLDTTAIAEYNRGVGLMGRFERVGWVER
jgi:hypothetical protein